VGERGSRQAHGQASCPQGAGDHPSFPPTVIEHRTGQQQHAPKHAGTGVPSAASIANQAPSKKLAALVSDHASTHSACKIGAHTLRQALPHQSAAAGVGHHPSLPSADARDNHPAQMCVCMCVCVRDSECACVHVCV